MRIVSPGASSWSALVTAPTFLAENSMKPARVGEEVRQKVASPTPKTDTSWNWPG